MAGLLSLLADWFIFYSLRWRLDREYTRSKVLELHSGLEPKKVDVLVEAYFRHYRTILAITTFSSLPWWVFTSWRWARAWSVRYRAGVGRAFLDEIVQLDSVRVRSIRDAYYKIGLDEHVDCITAVGDVVGRLR